MDDMENQVDNLPENTGDTGGNIGEKAVNTAQQTAENVKNVKKTAENIKNVKKGANAAKSMSMAGPLMTVLFWAFIIILIIIVIIGLVMFFITMPGMAMEKIKAFMKNVGDGWAAWFGQSRTEQIEDEEVYDILDYLYQMGYDLKGFGFLTRYATNDDVEDIATQTLNEELGVVMSTEDQKIVFAESDFIFTYLVSENYIYTIKNFNLDTNWWKAMWNHFGQLFSDSLKHRTGMLVFYHDDGTVGGTSSDAYDAFERGSIEVNAKTKELVITKGWFNGSMTFSLDGWTGRYGMPVDFLLSVHMATMMPDLAFDMVNSFQTEIKILLHESNGEIRGLYKTDSGDYVKYSDMSLAINGVDGEGFWDSIVASVDEWSMSKKEAQALVEIGIIPPNHPDSCGCDISETYKYVITKDDESTETVILYKDADGKYYYERRCGFLNLGLENVYVEDVNTDALTPIIAITTLADECKEFLKSVVKFSKKAQDLNFSTYMPYIENVTDHWYRDVYFISNSDVNEFVEYDYEYEAMMKERWTLYETYPDDSSDPIYNTITVSYDDVKDRIGEFIVYVIDENGEYLKEGGKYVVYNGSFDDARANVVYIKQDNGEYVAYNGPMPGDKDEDGNEIVVSVTLYRKDINGDFIEYNKDTDQPYAVAKKAITVGINEVYEDLNWNQLDSGVYSAYDKNITETVEYQLAYEPGGEDGVFDGATESEQKDVLPKIYNEIKIGVITQTGEGQRTETNTKIKKMFLTNKYFRYDGNTETAEIITKLRQDNDIDYGPLEEDDLTKTTTYKDKTYKVSDYAGTVTINQDSLNQFSILENTHTLDADYIYRDFKELVVELGYFEKEELTDETPRLLQFLIPQIGSANYSDRTIDKRENEFGTMIHSKYDIDANKKYTIKALMKRATEEGAAAGLEGAGEEEGLGLLTENDRFSKAITLASSRVNNDRLQLNSNPINLQEVGEIGGTKKPEQIPLQKFIKETEKMCKFIDEKGYNYCVMRNPGEGSCSCTPECIGAWETNLECVCDCEEVHCHHTVHRRLPCGLSSSFKGSQANPTSHYDTCCNYLVSWAFQNVGLLKEGEVLAISTMYDWMLNDLNGKEIDPSQPLKPGDILFYDDFGHVDGILEANGGSYIKFNGGHPIEVGAQKGSGDSSMNTYTLSGRAPDHIVRLNWGNQNDGLYEGYLGNEAVVSPVTGILLDYGVYDEESIDNVSGDEYRVNVDLKYGPALNVSEDEEGGAGEAPGAGNALDDVEKRIFSDKVGYAKILILNKETFEMLETAISNKWNSELLSDSGNFAEKVTTEEDYEEIEDSITDKTIYGYKEFTELYEKYGIAGNIIYIDGFKCELPDESFIDTDEDEDLSDESGNPNGTAISYNTFKNENNGSISEEISEDILNMYEANPEYKLASKSATEKLTVEESLKIDASPVVNISNPNTSTPTTDTQEILKNLSKLTFIKEGTVLGRTYVDRELVETRISEWGDDSTYNWDYYNTDEEELDGTEQEGENLDKVVGNYIRIIMRDHDDTVVENIEDYMKLDELKGGDQEYQFWEGDLEILADAIHHEGCGSYCASLLNTDSFDDKLYLSKSVGFTIINKLNTDSGFVPDYNDPSNLWEPTRSPLYNLLCRIPTGYDTGGYTTGTTKGWYAIALGLRQRIDANALEYCDICFEAAEYIKDNDSKNHGNNGLFGSDFGAGEPMEHTVWQQGAGYNGSSKIWVYIDKNNNGVKDTECVDSGDFYLFDTAN